MRATTKSVEGTMVFRVVSRRAPGGAVRTEDRVGTPTVVVAGSRIESTGRTGELPPLAAGVDRPDLRVDAV
ncbi:hypothetical protein MI170_22575 [Mycolicibacterium goodii]|uniref:hypothetical protein n=1 Tax=Mycolicibacterium goodii TaxID=134601 RepID=UPI001F03AFC1|nr:hypothetical protein [Mycolicibacterium goodii]ULN46080.1 hypothetical protein MI170_22575 [Mycolicibacterium goodii]